MKILNNLAIVSLLFLQFSCSSSDIPNSTNTGNEQANKSSQVPQISVINKAIDQSTKTKNTLNNYNIKFHLDALNAYSDLFNSIKNAKKSVYIEMYKFHDDNNQKKISDLLIEKSKQGVEVNILYEYSDKDNSQISLLKDKNINNINITEYNKSTANTEALNITHRKVWIFDGKKVILGEAKQVENEKYEINDSMISISGEASRDVLREFMYDWQKAGGKASDTMIKHFDEDLYISLESQIPLRIVVTSPKEDLKKSGIKNMMLSAIDNAKNNIKVVMPYFYDNDFINHLISAKQKGIDVKVFIPSKSEQSIFNNIDANTTNKLIDKSIEVYKINSKKLNYAKVLTVDDIWSTVGSCNADSRAFNDNQEINVAISDTVFTQDINNNFFKDLITNSIKAEYKNNDLNSDITYSYSDYINNLF